MASISAPPLPPPSAHGEPNPHRFPSKPPKLFSASPGGALFLSRRASDSALCRCRNPQSEPPSRWWDSLLQDVVRGALKKWGDYVSSAKDSWPNSGSPAGAAAEEKGRKEEEEEEDWDWERWKRHFAEVEEEERRLSALKSRLSDAIAREDYEDAAKLKSEITAAVKNDTVGTAISDLNRAIEEERYNDAAFFRDHAGAGLVGWWAGISEDAAYPYGQIIRISAEHGRYLAKSYNSRQLATARPGFPVFEIFFTLTNGKYKQQAVYWNQNQGQTKHFPKKSAKESEISSREPSDRVSEDQNDLYTEDVQSVEERDDDSDVADGLVGIQNILQDMIPGVKVRVLKVVSPGTVDKDLISKVIEQIIEEENDDDKEELESTEPEDIRAENDLEEVEMDARDDNSDATEEQPTKFIIGAIMQKHSADVLPKDSVRMPARLENRDRSSFSIYKEQDDRGHKTNKKRVALQKKFAATSPSSGSADLVMSNIDKAILSKSRVFKKVLKDVEELITYTVNQNQNHQLLSGATLFSRIEIPTTSDPLSGLYVGAHGMHTSEILHLKRKFGQWQEEYAAEDLEFYEYVEAIKLTGFSSLPSGQVAFRAKVGKQYRLPHKGIIPEEFGVVARYKGQGRIADHGSQNPRWVDGELMILDGKHIRGGPVLGFVYWAPEFADMKFFHRLRLPD